MNRGGPDILRNRTAGPATSCRPYLDMKHRAPVSRPHVHPRAATPGTAGYRVWEGHNTRPRPSPEAGACGCWTCRHAVSYLGSTRMLDARIET
jgi:hypothetical protein